jgi:predicted nucleic acid-binding protein
LGQTSDLANRFTPDYFCRPTYVARKAVGLSLARQAIKDILTTLSICTVDYAILQNAEALQISDFEDAVQIATAQAANLDAIITRNPNDFKASSIAVYEPVAFLALL